MNKETIKYDHNRELKKERIKGLPEILSKSPRRRVLGSVGVPRVQRGSIS
jgi:hypothetical protein